MAIRQALDYGLNDGNPLRRIGNRPVTWLAILTNSQGFYGLKTNNRGTSHRQRDAAVGASDP
jgi:hypothetical protein